MTPTTATLLLSFFKNGSRSTPSANPRAQMLRVLRVVRLTRLAKLLSNSRTLQELETQLLVGRGT